VKKEQFILLLAASMLAIGGGFLIGLIRSLHHAEVVTLAATGVALVLWACVIAIMALD
jgi:hypothetical protein